MKKRTFVLSVWQISLKNPRSWCTGEIKRNVLEICSSLFQFCPEDQAEKSRLSARHLCLQRPATPAAADQQQRDRQQGTSGKNKRNGLWPPPPPRPAGQRWKRAADDWNATGQRSRWATLQGQEVMHGGLKGPRKIPVAWRRCCWWGAKGGNQGTNLSSPAWTETRFHFSIHRARQECSWSHTPLIFNVTMWWLKGQIALQFSVIAVHLKGNSDIWRWMNVWTVSKCNLYNARCLKICNLFVVDLYSCGGVYNYSNMFLL